MDRIEAGGPSTLESKNVADAKAAFHALEGKLDELGRAWEPDVRSFGIPVMDSREAVQKVAAIRAVVARNKTLAEKPNLMRSEAEQFAGQSSVFSSSLSYVNYLLGKKRDARADSGAQAAESAKWMSVKNADHDIGVLLDMFASNPDSSYSSEEILRLRFATEYLVKQAEQEGAPRDAALVGLQETLSMLRRDALTALDKEQKK